jgi:hypothetical protein
MNCRKDTRRSQDDNSQSLPELLWVLNGKEGLAAKKLFTKFDQKN